MLVNTKSTGNNKGILLPEDRQFLESILGTDTVNNLEKDAAARGKVLEDAGVNFKTNGEAEPSSELALVIAANVKMFTEMTGAMHDASEVVKAAAKVIVDSDMRIAELETKIERQNLLLMSLLAPQAASKSIFTQLTPEEKLQLEKLQAADAAQQPAPVKGKSLLEQLAEQAGAAPISG